MVILKNINVLNKETKMSKNIENKIKLLENKIDQMTEILNTFTILISDMDYMDDSEIDDEEENEDWTPYDQKEDYEPEDNDEDQY